MGGGRRPVALLAVVLAMAVLFTLTGFLAGAYRTARYNRAERHFIAGNQLAQAGKGEPALEEYRAALSFDPNNSRYRLALALGLLQLGRLDEAEARLAELREADPTSAVISLGLARIAGRQGKSDDAILYYHRALFGFWPEQAERNRVQTRLELIQLLTSLHRQKTLLGELLELAAEAPSDLDIQKLVGSQLVANGAPRDAVEIFQNILRNSPKDAVAWRGLGEAQFTQGDYSAARKAFQRAVRWDPRDEEARRRLAECDQVTVLDPTLPLLASTHRYERSRQLVSLSLGGLEQCEAAPGVKLPDDIPPLTVAAHTLLDTRVRRHQEDDTPKVLTMAQDVWKAWNRLCPEAARSNEPLAIVINKVSK